MHIRTAQLADVPAILDLVNEHVRRGDVLPRTAESIRETLPHWLVGIDDEGDLIACVSLLFYTEALAEVRSLAVADKAKGQGLGRLIVRSLITNAKLQGVPTLFALTRAVGFFEKLDFTITSKERFPQKVWRDCIHCPLLENCDETAVVLQLNPTTATANPYIPLPTIQQQNPTPIKRGKTVMSTKQKVKKAVLAYSGGLDTSIIVHWLKYHYGCEVICFCANIGQGDADLEGLEKKAYDSGASKVYIEDLRHEFAKDFLFPMLLSGAIYERQYLLGTSVARPIIAKWQVAIAEAEGADAVAHGATGKGNDQVRFELTYQALNPTLKVIAPWRSEDWGIRSREDALDYAEEFNIPVPNTKKSIYSRDANLWHISHEGGILEDPSLEPEESMYKWTVSPMDAPDEPEEIKIDFEKGIPVAVNDVQLPPASLIEHLNEIGSKHGIGRVDLVENRLVGMKSHGVYETPGGSILYACHRELESLCLDRDTAHYKEQMAVRYAELVYFGKWYHSLREAMQEMITFTQDTVTGWVKVKLYKGNIIVAGRHSQYSLYREDFATFGEEDVYDQKDAVGFIKLFGLQMKVQAMMDVSDGGKTRYAAPDYSKFKRD